MSLPPLKVQVLSSLRWNVAAKFGGQLINWAITFMVFRLLLPADYGLMAMANVVIGLLTLLAEMGLGSSLVQSSTLGILRTRQLWGAACLLNASIYAALFLLAPLISAFYGEPRLSGVIRTASFGFIINAIALVPDAMLRKNLQFKRLSIIDLTIGLIGSLITLALAFAGTGVWALVLGPLGAGVVRATVLHVMQKTRYLPSFSFTSAQSLISFGAQLTATRFFSYIFSQTDILIAGKLFGKEVVGIYFVAVHLATLPMQRASSVINDVAFSAFARIQSDRLALASNVRVAVRLTAFFAFPALWGLALVAPEFVPIALGATWNDATVPLQIIVSAVPLRMVGTVVSTALISAGRVDISMITSAIAALLALPLFIFAARYGIVGLSMAWVVIMPVVFVLNVFRSSRIIGVSVPEIFADLSGSVASAAVMCICLFLARIYWTYLGLEARLALSIGFGMVLYASATYLLNRRGGREALRILFPRQFT